MPAVIDQLTAALTLAANFIENVSDDTPDRNERFFAVREAWRDALAAAADVPTVGQPLIVVHMDGGIIQSTTADRPVSIMVIDYDCEGCDEEELTEVDQGEDTITDAYVFMAPIEIEPAYCQGRHETFAETDGSGC